MDEDHGAGSAQQSVLENFTGINHGLVDSSHYDLDTYQLILSVQIQDEKFLYIGILQPMDKL